MCLIHSINSVEELQQAARDHGGRVWAEVTIRSNSLVALPPEVKEIRGSLDCSDCPQLASLSNLQRVEALMCQGTPLANDESSLLKIVEGRIILKCDQNEDLHCEDGHAVISRAKGRQYFWHGVEVPDFVILHPELITVGRIYSEKDPQVRRVMIYRYGLQRWLQDSGATVVDADPHFGTLYKIKNTDVLMLETVHPSREPEGHYFIPIPSFAGNPKLPITNSRDAVRSVTLQLLQLGILPKVPKSKT